MVKKILVMIMLLCICGVLRADIGISISSNTWNIGKLGPSLTLQSSTVTIYNIGTAYCKVSARVLNSTNWSAVQNIPGTDQFAVQIKGGDISNWQYLTNSFADTVVKQWFKDGSDIGILFKYFNPANSSTVNQQTIQIVFNATAETGYTYNQAGDFYWRDVGATDIPPNSDWSGDYDSILPSYLWSYMTGTTVGWMTYNPDGGSMLLRWWALVLSIDCPTCTTTIAQTCPVCGHQMVRWQTMGAVSQVYATVRQGWRLNYDSMTIYKPATVINSNLSTFVIQPLTWSVSLPTASSTIITRVMLSSIYSFMEGCSYCMIYSYYSCYWWGITSLTSSSYVRTTPSYSRIVILD